MQRVKKGDRVVVIAGKDKGSTGEVLQVIPADDKVVVAGVNVVTKHLKRSQTNPQGRIEKREAPIHLSNVMLADPRDGSPTRVRVQELEDGRRIRVAVRSGEQIDR
jgi:large subunit ribosomal protein L24